MPRFARLRFPSLIRPLVLALAFASVAYPADELRFNNGDRLTGELVAQANGVIRFRTPLLGEITVPSAEASVVNLPDTPPESLAGLPPPQPAATAQVAAAVPPAAKAAPVAAPATARVAAAQPNPSRWRGKVEFGFRQQSGSTETVDFSLRMEADRKLERNQFRATGRLLYGEKNDAISSDRYDASFRWRRDFSSDFFTQSLTTYLKDRLKSIDGSYEQNVGVGYRFLNRTRHIINAGAGLTGQYRDALGADSDVQLLVELFEDYTYKINGRFTLTQNALVQWSDEDTGPVLRERQNYKFQFDTALQGKVTERLSMNLRFEHEFDNAVSNRDARTDQRITSSLGYAF